MTALDKIKADLDRVLRQQPLPKEIHIYLPSHDDSLPVIDVEQDLNISLEPQAQSS